jgi:hypothetical protein
VSNNVIVFWQSLPTRNTIITIVAFATLATAFVFFLIGINRATDPNPNREANLARLAAEQREDVIPQYDANNTAIVTLREGQKSGAVILKEVTWFDEVKIDLLQTSPTTGGPNLVPSVLRAGDEVGSCEYHEIRLLNFTADTATFRFVAGGFCGGYCWHMYQPETYDDYVASLSTS